jgi:archaellum component FlaC
MDDLEQRLQDLTLELNAQIAKVLEIVVDGVNAHIKQVEDNAESLEQRLAMLTAGYAELATMITALVARVGSGSPEEIEAFNREVVEGRKKMLEMLKETTQQPFTAHQPQDTDE